MESIILLVLFGIASSVIQAVVKNSKQKIPMKTDINGVKPKVQPKNEAINKFSIGIEPNIYQEETRTEVYGNAVMQAQEEEPASAPRLVWMENITFDELQRSIIMAEVLGKPKALRKAIR